MMHGINNVYLPSISQYAAQGGRMSLPVDSASLIYSHFKYVSGTPAPEGTHGHSISRLNLLDALIGRLNQLSNNDLSSATGYEDTQDHLATLDLEALVDTYRLQYLEALSANAEMPYNPLPDPQMGGLLNILS